MTKFNLNDYETVDSRIKRFYEKHENGRITTEIKKISDDFGTVVIKAKIWIDEIIVSTGLAMEIKGQGFVNKECWLENCETSAIGRGLANLGFSGDKRPSREEMSKVVKQPAAATSDYIKARKYLENAKTLDSIDAILKNILTREWSEKEKEALILLYSETKTNLIENSVDGETVHHLEGGI